MGDQSSYDKGLEAGLKCRAMLVPHPIPWQPHPVPADAEPGSEWLAAVDADRDWWYELVFVQDGRHHLGGSTLEPGTVGTHCCRLTPPEAD